VPIISAESKKIPLPCKKIPHSALSGPVQQHFFPGAKRF
jgi:hypothetical protein